MELNKKADLISNKISAYAKKLGVSTSEIEDFLFSEKYLFLAESGIEHIVFHDSKTIQCQKSILETASHAISLATNRAFLKLSLFNGEDVLSSTRCNDAAYSRLMKKKFGVKN